ncbi:glycosyltransferase, partial [Oxalobacteraceae bacterium OM1]
MELLLWSCIFLIVYPYAIYPLVMRLIGLVRPKRVKRSARIPTVSILIPAYNEADCIAATVQNKLDQYYPADRMQIIVISDGSTDGTDEIVKSFADPRVTLLRREGREGKAAALND